MSVELVPIKDVALVFCAMEVLVSVEGCLEDIVLNLVVNEVCCCEVSTELTLMADVELGG